MSPVRRRLWWGYSGVTAVFGVTATGVAIAAHPQVLGSARVWVLLAAMLVLECVAARIARQRGYTTFTSATVLGIAALLTDGVAAGMLVLAVGGLATSLLRRRDLAKTLFNVGQLPLSGLAAGPLLALVSDAHWLGPPTQELVSSPVAIVAAVGAWFVVNLCFLTSALLLIGEVRGRGVAREMLRRHAPVIVAMLSLAPIVGIVATHALVLFPLLAVPTLSVLRLVRRFHEHQREAQHDALTGLVNRRVFTADCEVAVADAQQSGRTAAVLMVDLDDFKQLNDTHGHPAGDEALRVVGRRLRDIVRDDDTVARLGGDEFGVVLRSLRSPDDVQRIAADIEAVLGVAMRVGEDMWTASASVGWAASPAGSVDAVGLVAGADAVMYARKHASCDALAVPLEPAPATVGPDRRQRH